MNPTELLAENLKEALRVSHQYLIWATWVSLFFLAMSLQGNKSNTEFLDMEISLTQAQFFATGAFFILGFLAYSSVERVYRIKHMLRIEPDLLKATITFPSIPTINSNRTRVLTVLVPTFLFTLGLLIISWEGLIDDITDTWLGVFFLILFLNVPYFALAIKLKTSLLDIKYRLTDKDIVFLKTRVSEEVLSKIRTIDSEKYFTKGDFLNELKKLEVNDETDVRRIVVQACEHPYFED